MYESDPDPYCYPCTNILVNRLGLRDQAKLDAYEAMITAQRGEEPLPRGRLGYAHYRAIHRHLFQDVFDWAGKPRTVRIAKGVGICFRTYSTGPASRARCASPRATACFAI